MITSVLAKAAFEAASELEKVSGEDELAYAFDVCGRLEAMILSLNPQQEENPANRT